MGWVHEGRAGVGTEPRSFVASVILAVALSGCGDALPVPMDSGAAPCVTAGDCDDGQYCNGAEICDHADPSADPRGCAEWLSHQNERADAKAPAYCCNQAFIHDIAARGTGAAKRIEEAL